MGCQMRKRIGDKSMLGSAFGKLNDKTNRRHKSTHICVIQPVGKRIGDKMCSVQPLANRTTKRVGYTIPHKTVWFIMLENESVTKECSVQPLANRTTRRNTVTQYVRKRIGDKRLLGLAVNKLDDKMHKRQQPIRNSMIQHVTKQVGD